MVVGLAVTDVLVAVGGTGELVMVGEIDQTVAVGGAETPTTFDGAGVSVSVGSAGMLVASGEKTGAAACGTSTDVGVAEATSGGSSVLKNASGKPHFPTTTPPTSRRKRSRPTARPIAGRRQNHSDADWSWNSERTLSCQPAGPYRASTSTARCSNSRCLNAGDGSTCW